MSDTVKKFLIIRCGALGDLVYATSIIDAIQLEYGEKSQIDFVCTPGSGTLFNGDSRVNCVYPLKHKKIPLLLSRQKKAVVNASKKEPYDILINFEHGKQFKGLVKSIQATQKIGPLTDGFDSYVPSNIIHMVENTKYFFKEIVSEETLEKSFPKLVGTPKDEVIEKYKLSEKYIIISPSNSHQKKGTLNYRAWENESWKLLIAKLSKEIEVVIIGNRGEDEFFDKLKPYPKNVIDLVAKTSLSDLVGVISSARALVATDTGTAHMASAVNCEVFALIGPTPGDSTGPYQSPHNIVHLISAKLECSPCYKTEVMKNCTDNICMKQISVDMVYNSIKSTKIV
jgi:ADP-heptose:LPS heptosyltransferase